MVYQTVLPMESGDLEKILKYLPEPNSVEVQLYGDFDYSSISQQAKQLVKGAELRALSGAPVFYLEKPAKNVISRIYEKQQEAKKSREPYLCLKEATWCIDGTEVILTPAELEVRCEGKEPEYISKIRKELAKTPVRFKIEIVNKRY